MARRTGLRVQGTPRDSSPQLGVSRRHLSISRLGHFSLGAFHGWVLAAKPRFREGHGVIRAAGFGCVWRYRARKTIVPQQLGAACRPDAAGAFDWRAGLVLGAVVAPTDAVAATSIAKRIGLPKCIVDILEGESLLKNASALLALEFGIALLVGGEMPTTGLNGVDVGLHGFSSKYITGEWRTLYFLLWLKISLLVLGLLENSAVRSDNQHVGAPGSSSRCAVALIVY